jgi:hypothetical protein
MAEIRQFSWFRQFFFLDDCPYHRGRWTTSLQPTEMGIVRRPQSLSKDTETMLRQFCIISIAVAVALIGTVADSRTAEAQGFFRRLQDRILSRDEPAAETEQTPQSQTAPPRQPQYAPNLKPGEPQGERPLANIDLDRFGHSILYREPPANAVSPPAAIATVSLGRPSLGISVVESKSGVPGLQVDSIRTDSMAEEAGLKEGDLIIAIDGTPTPAIATVVQHLEGRKIGDRVRATVVSETKTKTISIQLVADVVATAKPQMKEPAPAPKDLGVKVEQSPGVRGVIVSAVDPHSGIIQTGPLDLLDGTPVLDVKPYMPSFDAFPDAAAGWMDDAKERREVSDGRFEAP